MRLFILIGAFLAAAAPAAGQHILPASPNYTPAPLKEGYSYPDCYCTDSAGDRVEMGRTACLTIGGRKVEARCEFSVNSPIWRIQSEGCPGV